MLVAIALATLIRGVIAAPSERDSATARVNASPTFTKNVAPILYHNCVRCHRQDGPVASVPLVDYDTVRRKAKELRDLVSRRQMPPWPADSAHSLPFSNDPRLSQADIDTVVSWVDAGAPQGNSADLPPSPIFTKGWLHPTGRAPDAVVSLPQFTVAANGVVPYIQRLMKVPLGDRDDRWISALQVRVGNPVLLHHMGITEVVLPDGVTPETMSSFDEIARQIGAPSGALQIQHPAVEDSENQGAYDMLGIYTPGTTFETYGDGNGKLLKGGKNVYINFNIHYTTTGREETDSTQLALWFSPSAPHHVLYRTLSAVRSIIANGRELLTDDPGTKAEGTGYALPPILANADHYELIGLTAYERAIVIYQLQPHAHVRATDFKYVAVFPDGRELTLLTVPHYNYHFQLAYELATPLTLPAGSKIIVTGHYNNSARNPQLQHLGDNESARKCGPDNVAYFGQQNQSWDEMFSPFIQYSTGAKSARPVRLVTAVGCLAPGPAGGWKLLNGSKALTTHEQGTSAAELSGNSRISLGEDRYQLLGADVFNPGQFSDSRVVVKGALITAPGGARINVTSMQRAGLGCPH
jgi:hypothetical protein